MNLGDVLLYDKEKKELLGTLERHQQYPKGTNVVMNNPSYSGELSPVCDRLFHFEIERAGGLVTKFHGIDADTPWDLHLIELTKVGKGKDSCLYGDFELINSWNHTRISPEQNPIYFTIIRRIYGNQIKIANKDLEICLKESACGEAEVTYSRDESFRNYTEGIKLKDGDGLGLVSRRCNSLFQEMNSKLEEVIEKYKIDPQKIISNSENEYQEKADEEIRRLQDIIERNNIINSCVIHLK